MQTTGIAQDTYDTTPSGLQGFVAFRSPLVTTLLQAAERAGLETTGVLTVREVATLLRVSTATVYAMVARGELPSARVSNAIRIVLRGVG